MVGGGICLRAGASAGAAHLDVLDFPASLEAVADADTPGWGVQAFGGGEVFADPERAARFRDAVERMRPRAG